MITALLKTLIALIGILPLPVRRVLARMIGTIVSMFPSREREVCCLQLKKFIGAAAPAPQAIYQHLVTVLFESFNLTPLLESKIAVDDSSLTQYWKSHDKSQGIVALSAHLGNWELLAACAMKHAIPLQVVGREARRGVWQQALEDLRKKYGAEVLWRADSAALKKIIQTLRSGGVVAALIDQDTEVTSIMSPFMGVAAKTPSSLIELGMKSRAKFVTAFTTRTSSGTYQIEVQDIAQSEDTTVEQILATYHQRLEHHVRSHPEQWVWVHKRWRTLPDGKRLSSREYLQYLTDQHV